MLGVGLLMVAVPLGQTAQQGGDTGTPSSGGGGGPPDPNWRAYGNLIRGSEEYYGTKAFLGLAAKGNIVIGNYTAWDDTPNHPVYEMIDRDTAGDTTRPYVLPDRTDQEIGYGQDPAAACGGQSPCFSGDYTARDGGQRCAGATKADCGTQQTNRRFYESSLADDVFRNLLQDDWTETSPGVWERSAGSLVDPIACYGGEGSGRCKGGNGYGFIVNATLYTNHALIGDVGRSGWLGAWVARDDAMRFQGRLDMTYDWRLQDPAFRGQVFLPMEMAPAQITAWQEVTPEE
jgi:hypothetical protein